MEVEWPKEEPIVDEDTVYSEVAKSSKNCSMTIVDACVMTTFTDVSSNDVESVWYLRRFSDYSKIVRIVAWILRFACNTKNPKDLRIKGEVTSREFIESEKILFRLSQSEQFSRLSDERLKNLDAYTDDSGMIRIKTLVSNRQDDLPFRCPPVIDSDHPLTRLLIEYEHKRLNHAGISTTMASLRERVWILSCRRAVRSVIQKCTQCRTHAGKGRSTPGASLPQDRVRDAEVFEIVGIDYAGPLYLKDNQKSWVCLFTCAVYRTVHFELATSLSTVDFLEALSRFIGRRGRPSVIYSDNGTTFVGANNLLKSVDWDKIRTYCATEKIDWRFNPPSAAWWGGWWERMLRILKDLLKRTLGKATLGYQEMTTILCECEAIVNTRPLTHLTEDKGELVAIMPEMFLKKIREDTAPDLDNLEKISLSRRLRYRQRLREEMRKKFRAEYLDQLSRHTRARKIYSKVKAGDIVLIENDNPKRIDWHMARVICIIPGHDGVPRIAKLRTATGELIRPLQRLIILKASIPSDDNLSEEEIRNGTESTDKHSTIDHQEEATSNNCEERRIEDISVPTVEQIKKYTRSGRLIKIPKKYS